MSIPDVSILQKMAAQSYEAEGSNIDGWQLYKNTPTLKFYWANKTLVIAIRGTFDSRDVAADGLIALGSLERSDRWKNDLPIIEQVISEFKPEHVYAVGHSLGGALLDLLLNKNIVEKGVSYNPAVQPQDILKTLPNRRIYMSDDPLYLLIGRFLKQKPEVRTSKASWLQTIARISPAGNLLTAKGYLDAHGLDSFKGGMRTKICKKCGLAINSQVFKKSTMFQ